MFFCFMNMFVMLRKTDCSTAMMNVVIDTAIFQIFPNILWFNEYVCNADLYIINH
jgi:hypothetical protein